MGKNVTGWKEWEEERGTGGSENDKPPVYVPPLSPKSAAGVYVCSVLCVEGWVEPGEVTVIPEFVDVHLSVAVGMQDATDQEWDDYMSMFALAVRHVHYYQISCCPGQIMLLYTLATINRSIIVLF